MRKIPGLGLLCAATLVGACGDDGGGPDVKQPLFEPKPECTGEEVVAYAGSHPQAISKLEIGSTSDGFDLDGDGTPGMPDPDNKLAAVASLANGAIAESLSKYEIVIPMEFFDLQQAAADTCVKFALYLGDYVVDADDDGRDAYVADGDCNDHDANIRPGMPEIPDNGKDDDCDGLADEAEDGTPSDDTSDADGDGVTIADGDCDDTNDMVAPGMAEVCHDGLDNDCDGVADRSEDAQGNATACSPFEPGAQDIALDPLSFENGTMKPVISFKDGVIENVNGTLKLFAGPSLFSVAIPVIDDVVLDLRITGAQIEADVVEEGGAIVLKNARLGGVIDAKTADTIRGLEVEDIGLTAESSLLDATFANVLGPLLALPAAPRAITDKYDGCRTPDIDVDQDGLESYCNSCSNPRPEQVAMCPKDDDGNLVDPKVVDVCIDGDGTEVRDVVAADGTVLMNCTEAMVDGKPRFVDGISVALKFETTAIKSIQPPR